MSRLEDGLTHTESGNLSSKVQHRSRPKSLPYLHVGSCVLESLDVSSNLLTSATLDPLCLLLGALPTLAALDLRANALGPSPARAVKVSTHIYR